MINQYPRVKTLLILFSLLLLGMAGWAMISKITTKKTSVVGLRETKERKEETYNSELFSRMSYFLEKLNQNKKSYFYSGKVKGFDEADESGNIEETEFKVCKEGDEMYYRMGTTETMVTGEHNIEMDHSVRKILMKKREKGQIAFSAFPPQRLKELLESREYELFETKKGSIQTLSLRNDDHITCKEYAISYNTEKNMITRIFLRLTNLEDPMRTDNEKIVDFEIQEWEDKADIRKYLKSIPVHKEAGTWVLDAEHSEYELIQ